MKMKYFTITFMITGFIVSVLLSIFVTSAYFKQFEVFLSFTDNMIPLEYYFRLVISAILGFIIGLERFSKSKPIGLKTYTLISLGACLITIVSIISVNYFSIKGYTQMDPMRLVAQLLPAVGFVGAGTIWFSNNKVKGLTSAAFVFFVCTIGIGIGAGFYGITLFTFFLIVLFMQMASKIDFHYNSHDNDSDND